MKQRKQVLGALGALALGAAALTGCPGPQYPNCRGDQDCREHHEVCVNSHCQQCRTSAECADGGTCLRNRCLAGPDGCESDSDCTGGRRCVANHCVVPQCDDTHPCPGGAPCTNHQCPPADGGAVQRYLGSLGVELRRIYVSSEGAEAASGTDEAARTRDRRVDFRPRD